MKKNERRKVKLDELKATRHYAKVRLEYIKENFPRRHWLAAINRGRLRKEIKRLYATLFMLHAMEKQTPMPVKVVVDMKVYKSNVALGTLLPAILRITKSCQCQRCSNVVYQEVTIGYRMDKGVRPKYCPTCGQKLWWNLEEEE